MREAVCDPHRPLTEKGRVEQTLRAEPRPLGELASWGHPNKGPEAGRPGPRASVLSQPWSPVGDRVSPAGHALQLHVPCASSPSPCGAVPSPLAGPAGLGPARCSRTQPSPGSCTCSEYSPPPPRQDVNWGGRAGPSTPGRGHIETMALFTGKKPEARERGHAWVALSLPHPGSLPLPGAGGSGPCWAHPEGPSGPTGRGCREGLVAQAHLLPETSSVGF